MLPINKVTIGLFINFILFSGNVSGEAVEMKKDASETYSARHYCLNTGGAISETDHANQYICCYNNKCLLIDTKKGKSIILENK
jgi:hypothetical protein